MDALVVVSRHRKHDRFVSSPSRGFGGINYWAFESGILPSPPPPPPPPPNQSKRSNPISIKRASPSPPPSPLVDDCSLSELWAGPAYSNSPPPSSLPIPKFSLRQKRSVSLDLPAPPSSPPGIALHPLAKSAPASPVRESRSPDAGFFLSNACATENLRRILNLDIAAAE